MCKKEIFGDIVASLDVWKPDNKQIDINVSGWSIAGNIGPAGC